MKRKRVQWRERRKDYERTIDLTINIRRKMSYGKTMQQLSAEHSSAPTSMREYEIGGKRYIVTSHYAGEKEIDSTIRSIAIDGAKREMGIA